MSSPPSTLDKKGHIFRPAWEGFEDIEIPVGNKITLFGRLGTADTKNPRRRRFPAATSSSRMGFSDPSMVSIWPTKWRRFAARGIMCSPSRCGAMARRTAEHPEYTVSFGIAESSDLIAIAQWLKTVHGATRVGLVSFSLTGYEALLTAWLDGGRVGHSFSQCAAAQIVARSAARRTRVQCRNVYRLVPDRHCAAGGCFDHRYTLFTGPCKSQFQGHVEERMALIQQRPTYSLWGWAASEFHRAGWDRDYPTFAALKADMLRFIDLRGRLEGGSAADGKYSHSRS